MTGIAPLEEGYIDAERRTTYSDQRKFSVVFKHTC